MNKKTLFFSILLVFLFVLSNIAISWADSSACLIVRQADGRLWYSAYNDGSTVGWNMLTTGRFSSQPTVIWNEDYQRYELFGTGNDYAVWRQLFTRDCAPTGGWTQMTSGNFSASPIGAAGGGRNNIFAYTYSTSQIELNTTRKNIISDSLYVPDDGYIVATATGSFATFRGNNTSPENFYHLYLSNTSLGSSSYCDTLGRIPANTPGGWLDVPMSVQCYFSVGSAGTTTIYLTGEKANNNSWAYVYKPNIKLEYFPYRY